MEEEDISKQVQEAVQMVNKLPDSPDKQDNSILNFDLNQEDEISLQGVQQEEDKENKSQQVPSLKQNIPQQKEEFDERYIANYSQREPLQENPLVAKKVNDQIENDLGNLEDFQFQYDDEGRRISRNRKKKEPGKPIGQPQKSSSSDEGEPFIENQPNTKIESQEQLNSMLQQFEAQNKHDDHLRHLFESGSFELSGKQSKNTLYTESGMTHYQKQLVRKQQKQGLGVQYSKKPPRPQLSQRKPQQYNKQQDQYPQELYNDLQYQQQQQQVFNERPPLPQKPQLNKHQIRKQYKKPELSKEELKLKREEHRLNLLLTNQKLRQNLQYIVVAVEQAYKRDKEKRKQKLEGPQVDPEVQEQMDLLRQKAERLKYIQKQTQELGLRLDNYENVNNLSKKTDDLEVLKKQLQTQTQKKKLIQQMNNKQQKALSEINSAEDKQYLDEVLQQLREDKQKTRQIQGQINTADVVSRKWHKKYAQARSEINKIKKLIRENKLQKQEKKKKEKELMLSHIQGDILPENHVKFPEDIDLQNPTEFDLEALKERQKELEDLFIVNKYDFKLKRKDLKEMKEKLMLDQKKIIIILKEKQKERRLNQLKIREISRLMRYRQLKPINKQDFEDESTLNSLSRRKRGGSRGSRHSQRTRQSLQSFPGSKKPLLMKKQQKQKKQKLDKLKKKYIFQRQSQKSQNSSKVHKSMDIQSMRNNQTQTSQNQPETDN